MKANEAKRLKELEAENVRLKKLVANQALDIAKELNLDFFLNDSVGDGVRSSDAGDPAPVRRRRR
jgi:hypothetical protein